VLYPRRLVSVIVIKYVNYTGDRDGEKGMKAHSKFWKFHCENFMTFVTMLLYSIYFTYKCMQRFDYKILKYVVWVFENETSKTGSKHRRVYEVFQGCPGLIF